MYEVCSACVFTVQCVLDAPKGSEPGTPSVCVPISGCVFVSGV